MRDDQSCRQCGWRNERCTRRVFSCSIVLTTSIALLNVACDSLFSTRLEKETRNKGLILKRLFRTEDLRGGRCKAFRICRVEFNGHGRDYGTDKRFEKGLF